MPIFWRGFEYLESGFLLSVYQSPKTQAKGVVIANTSAFWRYP